MSTKIWTNSPHHWLPSFLFTFPTQSDNRPCRLTHGGFTAPSFPPELRYFEHFNVSYFRSHLSSSPSDFTTTTQCFLLPQPDFCSVMFLWVHTSGGDTFSLFLSICVSSDVQRLSCLSVVGCRQTDDTGSCLHVLVSCGVFLFDKNIWRVVRLIVSLGRGGLMLMTSNESQMSWVSFLPPFGLIWK